MLLVLALSVTALKAQESRFEIFKGDDVVGTIVASRTIASERVLYQMVSYSELDILWKRVVRTSMSTSYVNGLVDRCHSTVRVNGGVRDSSSMSPAGEGRACFVHPDRSITHAAAPEWTTARMYFEEPIGRKTIFIESVMDHGALRASAPGEYILTFPDGAVNRYVYRGGTLREIHVDRTFLDLLFKRT